MILQDTEHTPRRPKNLSSRYLQYSLEMLSSFAELGPL